MNLEKFQAEKLNEEQMHPLVGGGLAASLRQAPTNCGTAATRSEGADADVDNDDYATDTDAEITIEFKRDAKPVTP